MTRYAIDAVTALRLIEERIEVAPEHQLVGPGVLRSHVLSLVYARHRNGEIDDAVAQRTLTGLATMRIRLLSDRVSRATAWKIAREAKLADTMPAEYVAVAQLQADALCAGDPLIRRVAEGVVPLVDLPTLVGAGG